MDKVDGAEAGMRCKESEEGNVRVKREKGKGKVSGGVGWGGVGSDGVELS